MTLRSQPALSKRTSTPFGSWSRTHRLAFRFVFCFLMLYALDLLGSFFQRQTRHINGDYPTPFPTSFTSPLWHHLIPWIGVHLLHLALPINVSHEVGQDSPYEYILRGTEAILSLLLALLWSALDRTRQQYRTLNAWLRIFVRALLAAEMLYYGLAKLVPAQFGVLSLYRLSRPVGELWPMSMLWAFMAASPGYTILCGAVETAGGLLLLAPRTAMLGAFVSTFAMANVLALNIFYDVNQKIRCVYYLFLALFLLAPQLPGLWNLFLRKLPASPVTEPRPASQLWLRHTLASIPFLFCLLLLIKIVPSDLYRYRLTKSGDLRRGPNYGVWNVTSFLVADSNRPLLTPRLSRQMHIPPGQDHWRRLILDADNTAYLLMGPDEYDGVVAKENAATGHLELTDTGDPAWRCDLLLRPTAPGALAMSGTVNGNTVSGTLSKEDPSSFHVLDSPQWVSEGRRW